MLFSRALPFFALIGVTSVLAAPFPAGEKSSQPSSSEPPYDTTGSLLIEQKALLTGDWRRVPHPSNLGGLTKALQGPKHPDDWISFADVKGQFLWLHGEHGGFPMRETGRVPYVTFLSAQGDFRLDQHRVDKITSKDADMLVGYWKKGNLKKFPDPETRITRTPIPGADPWPLPNIASHTTFQSHAPAAEVQDHPEYIRIIFRPRKEEFLVRELNEKEIEWVKGQTSH